MADDCDLLCLDLTSAEAVRARQPSEDCLAQAAQRAAAFSDPTRLRVAVALAEVDELCGCDVAWILGQAQNLVSHHLRALRAAGLAASRRQGKTVRYALTPEGRDLLSAVLASSEVPASA